MMEPENSLETVDTSSILIGSVSLYKFYLQPRYPFVQCILKTGGTSSKSILIIVQLDATQRSLFIILQVHSTCFGCQPHPSSGVHKTVTTASGTVQLPPSNVAKLGHVGER